MNFFRREVYFYAGILGLCAIGGYLAVCATEIYK